MLQQTQPHPSLKPYRPSASETTASLTQSRLRKILRQISVTRILILVLVIVSGLSSLQSIAQIVLVSFNASSMLFLSLGLVAFLGFGFLYLNLRQGESSLTTTVTSANLARWERKLTLSALLLLGLALLAQAVVQLFLATDASLTSVFLLLPVLAPVLGLNRRYVVALSVIVGLVMVITYIIFNFTHTATTLVDAGGDGLLIRVASWLLVYIAVAGCTIASTSRLANSFEQEESQTSRISDLLARLEGNTRAGAGIGQDLAGVVLQLEGAASQQAGSSHEQVATVSQITSSLVELGETADQIAHNASNVLEVLAQLVEIAQLVSTQSEQAQTIARSGSEAVEQTNKSVNTGRERSELLAQRLLALTAQMGKVTQSTSFISEMTDETHLLSLNASIEAASVLTLADAAAEKIAISSLSTTGSNQSVVRSSQEGQGQKFKVIAQEIRNLSERSSESTEEINQAITEMQGGVAAAVLAAEESKKAMGLAQNRSTVAGAVIHQLTDAVNEVNRQFSTVTQVAEQVRIQLEEISFATSQQKTAISQAVFSMQQVAQVSMESAGAVSQIAQTVEKVNQSIGVLNNTLQAE